MKTARIKCSLTPNVKTGACNILNVHVKPATLNEVVRTKGSQGERLKGKKSKICPRVGDLQGKRERRQKWPPF